VRELMTEMPTILDQFAAKLGQVTPSTDVIVPNAHRLLGAARTLGARQLAQQLTEFEKMQPRDSGVFDTRNTEALGRLVVATDIALEHLEAYFQAALIGAEVNV
ncbi:MAG: Hpt domain-containing protein, partial [Alphaproteobacteria bacterium]